MDPIDRLRIHDNEVRGGRSVLTAYIKEDGGLVLEGWDVGEFVKEFWGDEDYEYTLYVEQEHKASVLRGLVEEAFRDEGVLGVWLGAKGIPADYAGAGYADTVLMLLIKERFESDSKFREWLNSKGIPSSFESWV